jgi:hypothetical protein
MSTPRKLSGVVLPCVASLALLAPVSVAAQTTTAKSVSFHNDVHPILQRKCQGCHQPAKPNGKLILTTH